MAGHPVFLIVPGAWHQPGAYQGFVRHLEQAGHSADIVSLPTCDSSDPTKATCALDGQKVHDQILKLINHSGKDVIVVSHSYGGIPAACGAYGLSKAAREREGKKGGVLGLVYVSSFVLAEKMSLLDAMGGQHAPYVDINSPSPGQTSFKGTSEGMYADVDEDEAQKLMSSLRPTSMLAFDSPSPPVAWTEPDFAGKLGFVRCMQDQALPPPIQDMFMEKSGVQWTVKEIQSSHFPFASKPEELIKLLEGFSQQFSG